MTGTIPERMKPLQNDYSSDTPSAQCAQQVMSRGGARVGSRRPGYPAPGRRTAALGCSRPVLFDSSPCSTTRPPSGSEANGMPRPTSTRWRQLRFPSKFALPGTALALCIFGASVIRNNIKPTFVRLSAIETACLPPHNTPLAQSGSIRLLPEVGRFPLCAPAKADPNLNPGLATSPAL